QLRESLAEPLQLRGIFHVLFAPDAPVYKLTHLHAGRVIPNDCAGRDASACRELVQDAFALAIDAGPLRHGTVDAQHETAARRIDAPAFIDDAALEPLGAQRRRARLEPWYENQRCVRGLRPVSRVHGLAVACDSAPARRGIRISPRRCNCRTIRPWARSPAGRTGKP